MVISLTATGDLPGMVVDIVRLGGGTGTGGSFKPGDTLTVTFSAKTKAGVTIPLGQIDSGEIVMAGPTSNYNAVLKPKTDVIARAVSNTDGTYSYTFADPIPANYAAPINDSAALGVADHELQGTPLLDGTYTVGMRLYKNFTIGTATVRDPGVAVEDFLLGPTATTLTAREVVKNDNCNACHSRVQAHGASRLDVKYCVLCHTSGAEDRNVASVAGGTPGVTIDFGVMIHRIHNAKHLPSVVGATTNADGSRNLTVAPTPYQMIGYQDRLVDFSEFGFPVMPSAYVAYLFDQTNTNYLGTGGNGPMPRDTGYATLTGAQKYRDDQTRSGVVACAKCHGDPDGAGALTAPAQGDNHRTVMTRKDCGACHDDVNWATPYTTNGRSMPPQTDDTTCGVCHTNSPGIAKNVVGGHLHPFNDAAMNPGVNVVLTSITGGTGASGKHVVGDPFIASFTIKNDAGANVGPKDLSRFQIIVTGPTSNPQLILPNVNVFDFAARKSSPFTGGGTARFTLGATAVRQTLAVIFTGATSFDVRGSSGSSLLGQTLAATGTTTAVLDGVTISLTNGSPAYVAGDRFYYEVVPTADTYSLAVPVDLSFEAVGVATGGADVMSVGNAPLAWGRQVVFERTVAGPAVNLGAASAQYQRFVVADKAGLDSAGIVVGDRVGIDVGGPGGGEYIQIGRIQTTDDSTGADLGAADRVWFTTALRYPHLAGAVVQEATLSAKREGIAYTVSNAATGELTLVAGAFTSGNPVVVSYRTDGRFGWRRAPGDSIQALYPPSAADSDAFNEKDGDWVGRSLVDGTYTAGIWANRDFAVLPDGTLGAAPGPDDWKRIDTDTTIYRGMSRPATSNFLFGAATAVTPMRQVVKGESCNGCHSDVQAHGFGRRGYETCQLCHAQPGLEDGPKFTYNSWYVGPTPGVAMDFRQLAHKVHAGGGLDNGKNFVVNGVFLGTPYPVKYDKSAFPSWPGESHDCVKCHSGTDQSWQSPPERNHPFAGPSRTWAAACGSCHDSGGVRAHMDLATTITGQESCAVCHGVGRTESVAKAHKVY